MDVITSSSWLNPALAAMEMSQMVVQAMWQSDPVLLQLPHFTRDLAKKCAQANISTIIPGQEEGASLTEMEVSNRMFAACLSELDYMSCVAVCRSYAKFQQTFWP